MPKAEKLRRKHHPAPTAEVFTDEEVIALEQDFIDVYLTGDGKINLDVIINSY